MSTMKAYRLHAYGGLENIKLDDVAIPKPGKGQVLVQVSKVGMNPFDFKIREGYVKDHMPLNLPTTLGVDFVGKIVSLGDATTTRFKPNDRVMTMSTSLGAYAEYITIPESILAKIPNNLADTDASTLPIPINTAWQTLHIAGPIKPGSKILIHGASGTCGAFAVQFAKAAGAHVIGTASGKNREYVLSLGADEFIDYQTEKFEDKVGSDVDLVLDYVLVGGANNTTTRSWGVLKEGGAVVSAADPMFALGEVPEGKRGFFPDVQPDVEVMERVAGEVARGEIKSKVARVFGRGELLEAMELNQKGGSTGRLIVDFLEG